MSSFIRRFLQDPGLAVLLEIESINLLDLTPPSSITGIGTGTVLLVGEFENGPFAIGGNQAFYKTDNIVEVTSAGDLAARMGQFGYTYGGIVAQNPCARGRKADGALTFENWNGNSAIQLNGKRFKRLIVCRVDTSVGSVELRREAYVTGAAEFRYNLEPSQVLALDIGAGPVSSTFTATAATVTSGAGVYPTLFVGGETLTLGYDGAPNFTVTFLAGDQTKAAVIARINAYAGFAFASDGGANLIILTSIQRGAGAQVRVVSGSAGVLATLGFTAATTLGTGNVQNIDAVTFEEVKAIVEAAVSGTTVRKDSSQRLRISKNFVTITDYIAVGIATTATGLGFTVDQEGSNDGRANYRSTAGTYPTGGGAGTVTLGVDSEPNFNVAIPAAQSQAQVIAAINLAAGYTMASALSATILLLRGRANGGQVRVVAGTGTALSDLGLTVKTIAVAAVIPGTIPAGTRVQNASGSNVFVTMQDVQVTVEPLTGVTASGTGPYTVKVRHALDDGTGVSALAGTISTTSDAPDLGAFQCVNPITLTAALTESAIDAQYSLAIDKTKDISSVVRETNIIYAARQSNAVRRKLRTNVIEASANGCFGRMAVIRTPLGTTKDTAKSTVAEPGVGAYRDQRVIFCYPQAQTFVPPVALRGLSGGAGFTADGLLDVGADGFMASILSQLNPEENPGQQTAFTDGVVSLETSPNAQGFEIGDYIAFKAKGIAALRMDSGVAIFQSGVTSVDPATQPALKNIARRRMADFIQDSLSIRLKDYGKRLSTNLRRKAILTEIRGFAEDLLGRNNPGTQRIAGYTLNDNDNTDDTLALGLFRITLNVRTLASLDSITVATTIGESVVVETSLPEAA